MTEATAIALASLLALESDGSLPRWIMLLPAGRDVRGRSGRRWTMSDPAAVAAASRAAMGTQRAVVDYEHATETAMLAGHEAPAAGWLSDFEARGGAIWGRVEWTVRAAAAIRAKEYLYVSPVFAFDAARNITRIARAALTNSPDLDMRAVARRDGGTMNEKLLALLKLLDLDMDSDDATVDAAIERIRALLADTASASQPDPAQWVPRTMYDEAVAKSATAADAEFTRAVEKAIEAGKVPPAQREWALAYARRDLDGFTAFCANQPTYIQPGATVMGQPSGEYDGLSPDEADIARRLGVKGESMRRAKAGA